MIYVYCTGHGGPTVVSNTHLEGTYSEIYRNISHAFGGLCSTIRISLSPASSVMARRKPDRLTQTGDKGITLKQQLQDKLIEHKQYIEKHGQDMPEILNWKWKG
jgi:phosphoketolase